MSGGNIYRRCGCTYVDPHTGKRKQYGRKCPKLSNRQHGTYTFSTVVHDAFGNRKQVVRGGFNTKDEAQNALDDVRAKSQRGVVADHSLTVGQFLDDWLKVKEEELRPRTMNSYRGYVRRVWKRYVGHIRLSDLRVSHLSATFEQVREKKPDLSASSLQRMRATLRSALADAVREGLIDRNPASLVKLPSGQNTKAVVWTPDRVEAWQETGDVPAKVMIWTPELLGEFLDLVADHPMYAYFHLLAYRGLRRAEGLALHWSDVDWTTQTLRVEKQVMGTRDNLYLAPPKSEAGIRTVSLDDDTLTVLRGHRKKDRFSKLMFHTGGELIRPERMTRVFRDLLAKHDLPPIRLHSLRHGAASLALASGADMKAVQSQIGHSSIALTLNTYSHVYPEVAHESANATASLVRRHRKTS